MADRWSLALPVSNVYRVFVLTIIHVVPTDPPRAPYLLIDGRRLDPGNLFVPVKENTELTVECVSEGGRPSPSLQWALVPGLGQPESLPGPQLTNSSEQVGPGARSEARITRIVRAYHNATVTCLVHHATLSTPLNASLLLDVQCKCSIPSLFVR